MASSKLSASGFVGMTSENIVRMVFLVQQAQYQHRENRFRELLTSIDKAEIEKLSALWKELLERHSMPGEALAILSRIIAADIKGSNDPNSLG